MRAVGSGLAAACSLLCWVAANAATVTYVDSEQAGYFKQSADGQLRLSADAVTPVLAALLSSQPIRPVSAEVSDQVRVCRQA